MSKRGPAAKNEPEEEPPKRLLFDASHNEVLDITADEYKPLREFLKQNNYEVYKLSQSPITADLIEDYTIFIIGGPTNSRFTEDEVTELMAYLREGGALAIIHQAGGDQYNNTNLTNKKVYNSGGGLLSNHMYFWETATRLTNKREYHSNGNLIRYYNYYYNTTGKLTNKRSFSSTHLLVSYFNYFYDSRGKLIKKKLYNSGDLLVYYWTYEYNTSKRMDYIEDLLE